jgi:nucleotide-binding universal stress UspA family protein
MFRTILVPLNGSRFAEAALPIAVRLARGARAGLHLVLAHQPVAALVGLGEPVIPSNGIDEDLRGEEQAYLADTAARLVRAGADPVDFREVEGPAGPAICEEASRLDADLIVLATHGRGAVGRLWLGSVADYVVRHIAVPALLIHPGRREEPPRYQGIREILVALDLTPHSEAILEPIATLAELTGAHVTLIHVVEQTFEMGEFTAPNPSSLSSAVAEASRAHAQGQLDRISGRLRERGVRVSSQVTIGYSAAGTLLEVLHESRFDMIAMTTHAVGGIRRLLMGSVAAQVVRRTVKPVLVLRPPPAF